MEAGNTCSVSVFFVRVGSQISPRRAKKDSNIPSPGRTRSVKCPTPGTTKTIKSPPHALPPAGFTLIGALGFSFFKKGRLNLCDLINYQSCPVWRLALLPSWISLFKHVHPWGGSLKKVLSVMDYIGMLCPKGVPFSLKVHIKGQEFRPCSKESQYTALRGTTQWVLFVHTPSRNPPSTTCPRLFICNCNSFQIIYALSAEHFISL